MGRHANYSVTGLALSLLCRVADAGRDLPFFVPAGLEAIMLRNLSIATIGIVMIAASGSWVSGASIGVGTPYPISNYVCEDGTRLAVRLLGDRASVSINDAAEVELPAMGSDGTTFSNGRLTVTIVEGRLTWGVGRAVPSACLDA